MESTYSATSALVQRLKAAEHLTPLILDEIEVHVDARHLLRILRVEGSTSHAIIKNWVFEHLDPGHLGSDDLTEAQSELTRRLQAILLDSYPEACNF